MFALPRPLHVFFRRPRGVARRLGEEADACGVIRHVVKPHEGRASGQAERKCQLLSAVDALQPTPGKENAAVHGAAIPYIRDTEGSGAGESEPEEWGPPVLLVDDLSVLLSLGASVDAVLDFSHYCRATVCSRLQGNVVMLARCDGEVEEDDGDDEGSERLLRGLTHQCSLTLHVQGLPTGYCRDIHGQVEVCWRRRRGDGRCTQKKLFQYKVHDKGASFFAPGTSSAVL
ncbi:Elongator complex protein 6 [Liparis tanakae]|uniref:Elongator complex protein 6 n=1 Tax=Liparis tanakae TaxID=230148 RepID=A0A4Z2FGB5_9TELE|nr:Elongator complex protein 6 [Liparis tanakae]